MRLLASENWLLEFGKTDDLLNSIGQLNGLTPARVQAAFDKQYGEGKFKAADHGTIITVWSEGAALRSYERRVADGKAISEWAKAKYAHLSKSIANAETYETRTI